MGITKKFSIEKKLTVPRPLGTETSTSYISNFCFFFSELRQRNVLPKVESPGVPLQRTISEPTLAESPFQSNQSGDSNKLNQQATERRKSNSLMNISTSSAGKTCACIYWLNHLASLIEKKLTIILVDWKLTHLHVDGAVHSLLLSCIGEIWIFSGATQVHTHKIV